MNTITFFGIELFNWLMILAVVSGPIAAVQVQKKLESIRNRRERQLFIFRSLMATRATPLSPDHVTALNLIDVDFSEKRKKEKGVIRAWRVLLDQFGKFPREEQYDDQNQYLIALKAATDRHQDKLVDLLLKMSEYLGYDFETVHIQNGCYAPTGHAEIENDNQLIRKGVKAIIGGLPINMNIQSLPEQQPHESIAELIQETLIIQKKNSELLEKLVNGETNIQISMPNLKAIDTEKAPLTGKKSLAKASGG